MSTIAALLVGAAVGMVVGAMGYAWVRRRHVKPDAMPADAHHVVELLRRAHDASAACVVRTGGDPVWSKGEPLPSAQMLETAESAAKAALNDSREHVSHGEYTIVSLGDGRLGCAVAFASGETDSDVVHSTLQDLRRLLAEFQVARRRELGVLETPVDCPEWLKPDSIEGIGTKLVEAVRELTSRPAALVVRDQITNQATVVAVAGTDRNLMGMTVAPGSVAGRACVSDLAAAGAGGELFGPNRQLRRQREDEGIAYSLRDGSHGIGALVVFCPLNLLSEEVSARLKALVADAGPVLGRAAAVVTEERRVTTDELTGQPNRLALEAAMDVYVGGSCSLLGVEIDGFESLDPPAAGAAIQHVARVFRKILRDYDVPARVGRNEFALFLPDTPAERALDVAERIQDALGDAALQWAGEERRLSCTFGVASIPDSASNPAALREAATAALMTAKQEGAGRVSVAAPAVP